MAWDIEFTDEFGEWFRNLNDAEKVSVTASVDLLEELGPALGRPHVDTLKGLPVPNMKELRVQQAGKPFSVSTCGLPNAGPSSSSKSTLAVTETFSASSKLRNHSPNSSVNSMSHAIHLI